MTTPADHMDKIQPLKHMGLKVLKNTRNCLKIEMPLEGNANHVGATYAGSILTLAEFPFGLMFFNRFDLDDIYPVVGEMTIRYMAPSTGSLTVEVNVSDEEWDEIERTTRENGKMKLPR
jgi:thioesterase domain-containing protein